MKKTCESCGGTGQLSYFGGESRFLLSHEECTDCCGTGYLLEENPREIPSEIGSPAGEEE